MARSVFDPGTQSPADRNDPDRQPAARREPIIKGGAASDRYIRAATRGGAERTYQEIPVKQIRDSAIQDRIDVTEDLDALMESIQENGQQIPILVRVVQSDGSYEIVVGRRRLAAIRKLGHASIKAFVARLDDREAFIAQGVENSARLETSYIERSRAAAQAISAGFDHQDVAQFLNISKTLMSFMIKSYEAIGEELVLAIGPARGIGRRKWDSLVQAMARKRMTRQAALEMVDQAIEDSCARFDNLLRRINSASLADRSGNKPQDVLKRSFGDGHVSTVRRQRQLVVNVGKTTSPEVLDMLQERLEEIIQGLDPITEGGT